MLRKTVTVTMISTEIEYIRKMAKKACMGGVSRVREGEDRANNLTIDQFVGQIGTYAFIKYWTGKPFPYEYMISRYFANLHPKEGDGGSDLPPANIDVKTSYMRASDDPFAYRLPVRPKEKKDNWIYVLALMRKIDKPVEEITEGKIELVGWARSDMFPPETDSDGPFKGAYVLTATKLNELMPLKYKWI